MPMHMNKVRNHSNVNNKQLIYFQESEYQLDSSNTAHIENTEDRKKKSRFPRKNCHVRHLHDGVFLENTKKYEIVQSQTNSLLKWK